MLKTGFICVYPDGKLVSVDRDSGGYPYPAQSPESVYFWQEKPQAEHYAEMFKLTVKKAILKIEVENHET